MFPQTDQSAFLHGKISPPADVLQEHTAPVSMRMPHLPITATTKTAEVKSSSSVSGPTGPTPLSDTSHLSQSAAGAPQPLPRAETPPPPGVHWILFVPRTRKSCDSHSRSSLFLLVRAPAPVRAVGSPSLQGGSRTGETLSDIVTDGVFVSSREDESVSCQIGDVLGVTAPRQVSGIFSQTDSKYVRPTGVCPSHSDDDVNKDRPLRPVGGKRRELVRSQTLPRNIGAQAHRPVFERLDRCV